MSHNPTLTTIQTPEATTTYNYQCQNNISSITKGNESFNFTYDGSLLTSTVQSGVLNQAINYTYNNDFIPSSMTYAGETTNFTYDNDGLLISIGALANTPCKNRSHSDTLSLNIRTPNRKALGQQIGDHSDTFLKLRGQVTTTTQEL